MLRGTVGGSTPSAMKPQPLFRMLPDPSFNDRCDGLHGALNVDDPIGAARKIEWLGQLAPKRITVAQAYHAQSANRGVQAPRQLRQQRVGFACAAEISHVDA